MLAGDPGVSGLETERELTLGDDTATGLASWTVADFNSSINESSERRLSSSEYSAVGT
jgi:hypothetical protein